MLMFGSVTRPSVIILPHHIVKTQIIYRDLMWNIIAKRNIFYSPKYGNICPMYGLEYNLVNMYSELNR